MKKILPVLICLMAMKVFAAIPTFGSFDSITLDVDQTLNFIGVRTNWVQGIINATPNVANAVTNVSGLVATNETRAVVISNVLDQFSGTFNGTFVGLGSAAFLSSNAFQSASATLTNLSNGNGVGLTNLQAGNLVGILTNSTTGNAATATTATTANNFSGSLSGNVTGTQGATVVSSVGGQTAANVASGAVAANAATSANTASTIVARDASGNFSASTITATNFTGNGSALTNLQATNLVGSLPQYPTVQIATNAPFTNAILMSPDGTNRVWSAGTNLFDVAGAGMVAMNAFGTTIPVNLTNTANQFAGNGGGLANLNATNLVGTLTNDTTGNAATAVTATNLSASSYYEVCTNGWRDLQGIWHPVSTTNSPGDSFWAAWTSSWTNLPSAGGEFRLSPGIFYRPAGWPVPTTVPFQCHIIGSAYPNTQLSGDSSVFYNADNNQLVRPSDITVEHVAFTFRNWSAKTVAVNMQGYSHSRLSDFLICWAGQITNGVYVQGYQMLPATPPGMLGLLLDGSWGYQTADHGWVTGCAVDLCSVAEHCEVNDVELHCASSYNDGSGNEVRGNLWTPADGTTFPSFVGYAPTSLEMSSGAALVDHRMNGDEVFNHIHIFQSMSGIYFAGILGFTGEYGVNYYDNIMFEDTVHPIVYDPSNGNTPAVTVNFNYYDSAPLTYWNYSSGGVFTQTNNSPYIAGYASQAVLDVFQIVFNAQYTNLVNVMSGGGTPVLATNFSLVILTNSFVSYINGTYITNNAGALTNTSSSLYYLTNNTSIPRWELWINNPPVLGGTNATLLGYWPALALHGPSWYILPSTYFIGEAILTNTANQFSGTFTNGAYYGNGGGLINLQAGNIVGTVSSATYAATAGTATNSPLGLFGSAATNSTSAFDTNGAALAAMTNLGNIVAVTMTNAANSFTGNGGGLTNLQAGNIVGTVSSATYATTAGTATNAAPGGNIVTNTETGVTLGGAFTGTATSFTLYGDANHTNWTYTDTTGWNNTNIAGGSVNIKNGSVTASGTNTAGYFIGNGGGLTNLTATNLVSAIGTWSSASNTLALNNGDWLLQTGGNGAITNCSGAISGYREDAWLTISNSSASAITFYWSTAGSPTSDSTNALSIPSYKKGWFWVWSDGGTTNYYNNVSQ